MSEEMFLASAQERARAHDPAMQLGRQFEADQRNNDAMVREEGLRNLGPAPKPEPQVNQDGSTVEGNLATQQRIKDRESRGTLDTTGDQVERLMGFGEEVINNAGEAVEQIGVGILRAAGSTLSAYWEATGVEEEMTALTSLVASKFNLPTLREPEGMGGKVVQEIGRYGAGFSAGTAIAKTAGLSWGYGQALFADAFAEFSAFDGSQPNIADAVGAFKDFKPEVLTELRADFVELLGKDADASELEERTKNMIANSGLGLALDGVVFLKDAVPYIYNTAKKLKHEPALMKEAHRLGLEAKRNREQGMVNDVAAEQRAASQTLMGSIAAIAEVAMRNAQGGGNLISGPKSQLGQIAFHGSPHEFKAFDLSKMGTGEGAQAKGAGMYFAESPGVASTYTGGAGDVYAMTVPRDGGKWHAAAFRHSDSSAVDEKMFDTEEAANAWVREVQGGNLYTVDVPDEQVARMLDLDKSLTEQSPEVQKALVDAGLWKGELDPKVYNGNALYKSLSERFGGDGAASEVLNAAGIPGNKYLDAGSRGKGDGTRNLVVFDPSNLRVIKRNDEAIAEDSAREARRIARQQRARAIETIELSDTPGDVLDTLIEAAP